MPLCSPGALVSCFVKCPSHNDKSTFELSCIQFCSSVLQQNGNGLNHTKIPGSDILYVLWTIWVDIESVTKKQIQNFIKGFVSLSRISSWHLNVADKMKIVPVAEFMCYWRVVIGISSCISIFLYISFFNINKEHHIQLSIDICKSLC